MELRKHLAIARQFARIGVIRKSQFRVEFFSQVVMDIVWYVSHVAVFEILMRHAGTLAGWNLSELRVFVAFLFVSDVFWMMWLGRSWQFGKDLKDGALDPVRLRPASPIFLCFFQTFSLEAVFNLCVVLGYASWAIAQSPHGHELAPWIVFPWAVAIAWWSRTVLSVLFSIVEFHLVNSDLSMFANEAFIAPVERPLDVFAIRVKQFLLFLVPVGALTQLPAALVLGRTTPLEALGHSLWLAAFGLFVFRVWRRSFRHYESAMS